MRIRDIWQFSLIVFLFQESNVLDTHALSALPGTIIIDSASQQTASGNAGQPFHPSSPPV